MTRRRAAVDPDRPGPYLKWAGNKAFLAAPEHADKVPVPGPGGRWGEPFMGAAGLYLSLPPERRRGALLSDYNPRIVGVHRAVRDHVDVVIRELTAIREDRREAEGHGPAYVHDHYYKLRDLFNLPGMDPASPQSGALFIALNHLCVNGLYRENTAGQFNVSVGDYTNPAIFDPDHLRACSRALQDATIEVLDCDLAIPRFAKGDGILLDPPYEPVSKTAAFTGYSSGAGNWSAQSDQLALPGCGGETKRQRLARHLHELDARGVRFLLTDADTPTTRALYQGWNITTVLVPRSMNSDGSKRGAVAELAIRNHPINSARP
jgi:DNA adenine methylase